MQKTLSSWSEFIDLIVSFEGFEAKTAYDLYGIPSIGHGFAFNVLVQKKPVVWKLRTDLAVRFAEAGIPSLSQQALTVLNACASDLSSGKKPTRDLSPIGLTINRQQARCLVESHVKELYEQVAKRLDGAWDTLNWAKRGGLLQWLYVRGIGALSKDIENYWRQGEFLAVADLIVKTSPAVIASRSKLSANLIAYGNFDRQGYYSVRAGDTLGSIIKTMGVTQQALLDANPALKANPNRLAIGQELKSPQVA